MIILAFNIINALVTFFQNIKYHNIIQIIKIIQFINSNNNSYSIFHK
jgi:hypothetical protein